MELATLTTMSLLAGTATGIGGLVAVFFNPKERNLVLGLGFSSGIMLGISFLMLVLKSLQADFPLCFIGFAIGALLFSSLDFIFPHTHIAEPRSSFLKLGTLVAIGIAIHDIPEGFGIGSGFTMSQNLGMKLTIGIMLHNIPEGIAIGLPFHFSGMGRFKTVFICLAAGISTLVGALLAFFLLIPFSKGLMYFGLAFAAGAMFYITVNELIPEAHNYGDTRLASCGVLAGILTAFLITQIGG